jgi:hypothetical protein
MSVISLQHAERILIATRKVQAVLKVVRAQGFFVGERAPVRAKLKKLLDWPRYSRWHQDQLEMIQVKLNRIESVRSDRNELYNCLPMARNLFTVELHLAMERLVNIFQEIENVVKSYRSKLNENFPDNNQDFLLYAYGIDVTGNNIDSIDIEINNCVKIIIEICESHLKEAR